MRRYLRPLASRLLGSAISLVCGILFARLVIETYGFETYAVASVLAAIPALLPFADLGLGASVVNASSDLTRDMDDSSAKATIVAAVRLTIASASVIAVVGIVLAGMDAWGTLLGVGNTTPGVNLTGASALVLVGMSVILSIFTRILQGSGSISMVYLITSVGPLVGVAAAFVVVSALPASALVGAAPMVGAVVASALCAFPAIRRYPGKLLSDILRAPMKSGLAREILSTASSSLVVTLGTVVAFQSDRIILGHLSTTDQVGQYSLVAPMYIAGYGLLNAIGQYLWPHYRALRAEHRMTTRVLNLDVARLGAVGLVGGILIVLLGPLVAGLMTGSSNVAIARELFVAFAILAVLQAVHLPSAMFLTDVSGWRFQRNVVIVMSLCKVCLSIALAPTLGAVGVVVATAVAILITQVPATYLRARVQARI